MKNKIKGQEQNLKLSARRLCLMLHFQQWQDAPLSTFLRFFTFLGYKIAHEVIMRQLFSKFCINADDST